MKRVYIFMLTGIIAIILVIVIIMNFDPKVETWGSVVAGAAFAVLIIKFPAIAAYIKSSRNKKA